MELHPASFYARELRPALPEEAFRPAASRLLWLPVHLSVVAIGTLAVAKSWLPWPLVPVLSVLIGTSFAGLMFLGHEVLHGAILPGRAARLRRIVGWICFAPFALSPTLWVVWHNRVHHANTNRFGADPDMYPTLARYEQSAATRWTVDHFALGGRRVRGILSLLLGFMVQSKEVLLAARTELHMKDPEYRRTIVETLLAIGLLATVAILIGPARFCFAYLLPLLVADAIVMAFILTNHALSPATEINDPLVNALSVTAPRWVEWATLHFGYHVEHHLFPAMSGRHAARVRAEVRERWPGRYQSMPIAVALATLHRTGRVYEDATTLIDPRTGEEWPTLGGRGE